MAYDVQLVSGSVAAGASYASVGKFTVPAGENRTLIGVTIKGNANDPCRLTFNAGSNKNFQLEFLQDDDPASRVDGQIIKMPTGIDVPANSEITIVASNSSGASVTVSVWLHFIVS